VKVGDLVTMEGGQTEMKGKIVFSGIGIVADTRPVATGHTGRNQRIGIFWCDGGGRIDWEPMGWLEVINECR